MKSRGAVALLLTVSLLLGLAVGMTRAQDAQPNGVSAASSLGAAFTYQGRLMRDDRPVNGTCDLRFRLFDAASGGSQVGSTVTRAGTMVTNGLVSVSLDFGADAFTGDARWLEVAVRCPAGSGSYTTLSPRQPIRAVPYALALPGLRSELNTESPNIIGGYSGNSVADGVRGATISGGGMERFTNRVSGSFGTVGGGVNNVVSGFYATIAGGGGNRANNQGATVGGGIGNTANWVEATVGGGRNNTAGGGHATVSGGENNEAGGNYATVSGGYSNTATTSYTSIGGGYRNTASGSRATIAGGEQNTASGYLATVGGGFNNRATGDRSVVAGGVNNTASGAWATVPGGSGNVAAGNYSFAAGRRAKANKNGCFVWADSTNAEVTCNATNRTIFRSSGGFYIYTNSNLTSGVRVAAGGGSWASLSDRNAKENIAPVDPMSVLEKLAHLPISTWNYKSQDEAIRHMGPMAQDFYAAFGLGEDDTHIGTLDAEGVLMAAVQGLYRQNQAQAQEITQLKEENAMLRARLAELAGRLERLEAQLQQGK